MIIDHRRVVARVIRAVVVLLAEASLIVFWLRPPAAGRSPLFVMSVGSAAIGIPLAALIVFAGITVLRGVYRTRLTRALVVIAAARLTLVVVLMCVVLPIADSTATEKALVFVGILDALTALLTAVGIHRGPGCRHESLERPMIRSAIGIGGSRCHLDLGPRGRTVRRAS